jgi:phosphoribosylformylglycinamidine synthase
LIEACRGCHDAALFYGTPFISGKDSLNNEYLGADSLRHSIPPTLLISAIGVMQDVSQSITMDLKEAGNLIYLVGELPKEQKSVPDVPSSTMHVYRAFHQAVKSGLIRSAHDLSEGGLAVAAAEMCIGGRLGMELNLDDSSLFTEANGCLLVEVSAKKSAAFENLFVNLSFSRIGRVTANPFLSIANVKVPVNELLTAFNTTF